MYQPLNHASIETISVRGLAYQVHRWGAAANHHAPLLVLLHGWGDVGTSYQFVVDALGSQWIGQRTVIAPDWRGFGGSRPLQSVDSFWFADYFADLDVLLNHYAVDGHPVDIVGHSMGGNVSMMYAGMRPERVRRLVNLEGFGLPDGQAQNAPDKWRRWLDETSQRRAGAIDMRPYSSREAVAQRLMKTNPRLPLDKALWLAGEWATIQEDGQWHIQIDPAHKVTSHNIYRADEVLALYQAITAPVLAVEAAESTMKALWRGQYDLGEYHQRLQKVRQHRIESIANAGHNLHHDQPEQVAQLIRDFLA